MSKNSIKMVYLGSTFFIDVELWGRANICYENTLLTFDTGASVTTISNDILHDLGYDINSGHAHQIFTASGVELVREVSVDKLRIGDFELEDVLVYAHDFPEESSSTGVIGLNVLSQFDINLKFSKQLIELEKI